MATTNDGFVPGLEGVAQRFRNPNDALVRGIALIHQETALAPDLTVAEKLAIRGAAVAALAAPYWRQIVV